MFIQQYILTRIILQRHKSFLLPSNFSPRVVQRLRHPPILILLYAASDNSNVAASDNHPSVPAAASPTTVANDTQAAVLAAMLGTNANGGKHVMVTRLLSGMPMKRNRRVIWMMVERCASNSRRRRCKTVSSQRISSI